MMTLEEPFRLATERDAPQLAELVNHAGEGLPLHVWTGLAREGEDPWAIGRARQAQKAHAGEVIVVDEGGGAVACLTGYAIGSEPQPIGTDMPALFRPLQELENRALDSWYVNVLACLPAARGQGIGSRLLLLAERIAMAQGIGRLSLIVSSGNAGARRLYDRHGFAEVARAPLVKEGWETGSDAWILLARPVAGAGASFASPEASHVTTWRRT
ncbi:GNAT family N-acetyltransferase [Roseobacter sp. HKCCA0434]|uniref:GNAT family N-acetyltransferase n=1 Tax=Roseobacter sp. HKCCA0434 TaxID=3079297 RepID=UPI002905E946|nr:GNAT family N-acetyltransferase [Roseobacter sp. HKCCA0434]